MEKTVLRNKSIGTKVSEEEYAALEKQAAARGLTLGEWFRDVVLGELVAQPAEQVILAEVLGLRMLLLNTVQVLAQRGEMTTEDPLQFAGDGPNFYAYTLNNPVNYVDPMGTSSQGPPPPPTPGPPGPAQLGGFIYNHPPPTTGPLSGAALALANCMAKCLARYFVVTGGSECTADGRHVPGGAQGSRHCTNQALDIRPAGQDQNQVFCCAKDCGAQYIQDEGDHWHIQLTPGRNGGHGLLPKSCGCK